MESSSARENPQPHILGPGHREASKMIFTQTWKRTPTQNADPHVTAASTASAIGVLRWTQKLLFAHPEAATILENKGTHNGSLNLPLHTVCERGVISLDVVKTWYHAYPQAAWEINKEGLTPFGVFLKRIFEKWPGQKGGAKRVFLNRRPKIRLQEERDEEKEKVMEFLFQVGALQPDMDGKVSLHRVVKVDWSESPLWDKPMAFAHMNKLMAFARMNIQQHPEMLFIFDKEGYTPLTSVLSGKVPRKLYLSQARFTNRTSPLEFGEIRVLDSINHQILQYEQNMLTRFVGSTLQMTVPALRARYMEGPSESFMKGADIVQAAYEGAIMAMVIHDEDSTHWDESALYPSSGILKFDVRAHQLRSLTLLSVAFHPNDFLKMIQIVGVRGLNLDNRNFESVTDFHSVCYVYGRLGGRNRLFRAQVR